MGNPIQTKLVSVKVLDVRSEAIQLVPGHHSVKATAVTFGTMLRSGGSTSPTSVPLLEVADG